MCDKEEKSTVDEIIKFESKIVFALGRLQSGCRLMSCPHNCKGVSSQALYEFIQEQYPELDGDIESQVITALQSCVRSGIICALHDGKYRLIGPNPKGMVSFCTRRFTHGPRCVCLALIGCMTKNFGKSCCSFSHDLTPLKLKCNKEIQTSIEKQEECPKRKKSKRKLENGDIKNNEEDKKKCKKNSKSSLNSDKTKSGKNDKNSNSNNPSNKNNNGDGDGHKNKDDGKEKSNLDIKNSTKIKFGRTPSKRAKKKFCSSCGKIKTLYTINKRKFPSRFD